MARCDKMILNKTTKDYKEKKDGGARLEQIRGGSEKESLEYNSVTRAMGLRSGRINRTSVSRTVPAAHIQEQSSVPCVVA